MTPYAEPPHEACAEWVARLCVACVFACVATKGRKECVSGFYWSTRIANWVSMCLMVCGFAAYPWKGSIRQTMAMRSVQAFYLFVPINESICNAQKSNFTGSQSCTQNRHGHTTKHHCEYNIHTHSHTNKWTTHFQHLRRKPAVPSGLRSGLQIRSRSPSSLVCASCDSSLTGGDNDAQAGDDESVRNDSLPLNSIFCWEIQWHTVATGGNRTQEKGVLA